MGTVPLAFEVLKLFLVKFGAELRNTERSIAPA